MHDAAAAAAAPDYAGVAAAQMTMRQKQDCVQCREGVAMSVTHWFFKINIVRLETSAGDSQTQL
jgi:hypothetical protein